MNDEQKMPGCISADSGTIGGWTIDRDDDKKRRLDQLIPRPCSICGKDMTNPETGGVLIGIRLEVNIDAERVANSASAGRVLDFYKLQMGVYAPMLAVGSPLEVEICWECWMKSMGVPVPEQLEAVDNDG